MALRQHYWPLRFAYWTSARPASDGFSLLVPVPGDLPVFLDLALTVCGLQHGSGRLETLVIPDQRTPDMDRLIAKHRSSWDGELRLVELPLPERRLLPRLRDPGRNHGVQLIAGVQAARGTHVVLHDADLFLLDPLTHQRQFERARDEGLAALGVSPPWDPWYAEHGLGLAATWELCAEVEWLRGVRPHRHLGHDAVLFGERHTFDTTFWAQARTPGDRIAVQDLGPRIIHFNYVISAYRAFQRSSGTFRDERFRLLLIRVLLELFDEGSAPVEIPSLAQLAAGLDDENARVSYVGVDASAYRAFRSQLDGIVTGPWAEPAVAARTQQALDDFDERLGLNG